MASNMLAFCQRTQSNWPITPYYPSTVDDNLLRLEKEKATLAAEVSDLQGIVDHATKNQVTTHYGVFLFLFFEEVQYLLIKMEK